jgi:hypothetical protein
MKKKFEICQEMYEVIIISCSVILCNAYMYWWTIKLSSAGES